MTETKSCLWSRNTDDDNCMYETTCGNAFMFNDGTPKDNGFRYCCYCGNPMLVNHFTDEDPDGVTEVRTPSAADARTPTVPEGWKLVPVEPTPEMLRSVDDEADDVHVARGRAYSAWKSMLRAAPTSPVPASQPGDAVWEALQRLIENAATLGPSSQEDAMVVARWRGQFVAARESASRADGGVQ